MTRPWAMEAPWRWGLVLAVALGAGIGAIGAWSLAVLAGVGAAIAVLRDPDRSGWGVAAYWLTFCVYEVALDQVLYVPGLFYPFYVAFGLTVLVALLRSRLVLDPPLVWPTFAFLVVVAVSFVGFTEPIDFNVLQRVVAYLIAPLAALQFASRRSLLVAHRAAIVAATATAGWVVIQAFRSGFADRGGITADPNVASFFIGLGVAVALADVLASTPGTRRRGYLAIVWTALALMVYALVLLASRGIAIAVAVSVVAIVIRATARRPARLAAFAVAVALFAGATFLPGGDGLLERFSEESVTTGNARIPVWIGALRYYADGNAWDLALGHGFGSSWTAVQRVYATLTSTHNGFLQFLVEFGLVGLLAFLVLHLVLVVRSFRVEERFGAPLFGLVIFLLASNMTLNATDGFMYWTALGVAIATATWAQARPPRGGGP